MVSDFELGTNKEVKLMIVINLVASLAEELSRISEGGDEITDE